VKVWFSEYQLFPREYTQSPHTTQSLRDGAILKVQFDDGNFGYSDLCPHTKFGDAPLSGQLQTLHQGRDLTPILHQSITCAKLDHLARQQKRHLVRGDKIKSHFLITDLLIFDLKTLPGLKWQGYEALKIKLGDELALETEMLRALCESDLGSVKLRLDFNSKSNLDRMVRWLDQNGKWLLPLIEFIEDPSPYDPGEWTKLTSYFDVTLAVDFGLERKSFELGGATVVVLKPAVQDTSLILSKVEAHRPDYVATHYLDFPVGQMFALAVAEELQSSLGPRLRAGGFQMQDSYARFEFQDLIVNHGAYIVPPVGFGLGFDQALQKQDWILLT